MLFFCHFCKKIFFFFAPIDNNICLQIVYFLKGAKKTFSNLSTQPENSGSVHSNTENSKSVHSNMENSKSVTVTFKGHELGWV